MLTDTERARIQRTAMQQARDDRDERSSTVALARALTPEEGACTACRSPYSKPVPDQHDGIVCSICGEDWT